MGTESECHSLIWIITIGSLDWIIIIIIIGVNKYNQTYNHELNFNLSIIQVKIAGIICIKMNTCPLWI